jgi:hypothetical protein
MGSNRRGGLPVILVNESDLREWLDLGIQLSPTRVSALWMPKLSIAMRVQGAHPTFDYRWFRSDPDMYVAGSPDGMVLYEADILEGVPNPDYEGGWMAVGSTLQAAANWFAEVTGAARLTGTFGIEPPIDLQCGSPFAFVSPMDSTAVLRRYDLDDNPTIARYLAGAGDSYELTTLGKCALAAIDELERTGALAAVPGFDHPDSAIGPGLLLVVGAGGTCLIRATRDPEGAGGGLIGRFVGELMEAGLIERAINEPELCADWADGVNADNRSGEAGALEYVPQEVADRWEGRKPWLDLPSWVKWAAGALIAMKAYELMPGRD